MNYNDAMAAIDSRSLVRISENNGTHKGTVGIALGYRAAYQSVKVGMLDADGNYSGDYTMVYMGNVDAYTEPAEEAAPKTAPKLDNSERAARDLLNRKVREGVIDRRTANDLLRTGLPFARTMLADWRRQGLSREWITAKFQEKRSEAEQKLNAATTPLARRMAAGRVVPAELYLAVWAGLQADYAQYLADTRKSAQS